jgi:hypothetical protein
LLRHARDFVVAHVLVHFAPTLKYLGPRHARVGGKAVFDAAHRVAAGSAYGARLGGLALRGHAGGFKPQHLAAAQQQKRGQDGEPSPAAQG